MKIRQLKSNVNRQFASLAVVVLCVAVLFAARPAPAHHAFAAFFDPAQAMEVTGVVSEIEWANPHVWVYLEVSGANGAAENWGFELGSVNQLVRLGWSRDALAIGDEVTITGVRARDSSLRAAVRTVTLAGGKQLFGGQNESR